MDSSAALSTTRPAESPALLRLVAQMMQRLRQLGFLHVAFKDPKAAPDDGRVMHLFRNRIELKKVFQQCAGGNPAPQGSGQATGRRDCTRAGTAAGPGAASGAAGERVPVAGVLPAQGTVVAGPAPAAAVRLGARDRSRSSASVAISLRNLTAGSFPSARVSKPTTCRPRHWPRPRAPGSANSNASTGDCSASGITFEGARYARHSTRPASRCC